MAGCTGAVETTEDSTQLEMEFSKGEEVPKVEMGDDAVDTVPSTDDDIEIDTPLKGDS